MVGVFMNMHFGLILILLCLTGCPDTEQYAKADDVVDAALEPQDSASTISNDQFTEPTVDQGQPPLDAGVTDARPADTGAFDADAPGDLNVMDDALPSTGDDSGIPEECTIEFDVILPEGTPEEQLYIAGEGFDAAEWEPGIESLALNRQGNRGVLAVTRPHLSRITYKYTRGTWDSVEGTVDCREIENRSLVIDCGTAPISVQDVILNWVDQCSP